MGSEAAAEVEYERRWRGREWAIYSGVHLEATGRTDPLVSDQAPGFFTLSLMSRCSEIWQSIIHFAARQGTI